MVRKSGIYKPGKYVKLIRVLFDGSVTVEWLDEFWATYEVLYGEANGRTVKSARIENGTKEKFDFSI